MGSKLTKAEEQKLQELLAKKSVTVTPQTKAVITLSDCGITQTMYDSIVNWMKTALRAKIDAKVVSKSGRPQRGLHTVIDKVNYKLRKALQQAGVDITKEQMWKIQDKIDQDGHLVKIPDTKSEAGGCNFYFPEDAPRRSEGKTTTPDLTL